MRTYSHALLWEELEDEDFQTSHKHQMGVDTNGLGVYCSWRMFEGSNFFYIPSSWGWELAV